MFVVRYKELFTPYIVMSVGYAELFNRKFSIISAFRCMVFICKYSEKIKSVYKDRVENYVEPSFL